jgi:hypothetical protein
LIIFALVTIRRELFIPWSLIRGSYLSFVSPLLPSLPPPLPSHKGRLSFKNEVNPALEKAFLHKRKKFCTREGYPVQEKQILHKGRLSFTREVGNPAEEKAFLHKRN